MCVKVIVVVTDTGPLALRAELVSLRVTVVVVRWVVVIRGAVAGARLAPAEIGSEESPMCWLVSRLVAHVIAAVRTIPSSAPSAQIVALRLIRPG